LSAIPGCITLDLDMTPRTLVAVTLAGLSIACAGAPPVSWKDVNPPEVLVETLPPGVLVAANGTEIGRTPLSFPVPDETRTYQVRATAQGFEPMVVELPGSKLAGTRLELVLRPIGFGSQRRLLPGEPVDLAQAAFALLRADRPADALAFAQASLAAGESPQGHKIAGEAYRRLGNRNQAIQEFSIYLTLAPDAPDRKEIEQAIASARKDIQMTQPKLELE
jgi:tetratricopeptide (TPR) repeat protein